MSCVHERGDETHWALIFTVTDMHSMGPQKPLYRPLLPQAPMPCNTLHLRHARIPNPMDCHGLHAARGCAYSSRVWSALNGLLLAATVVQASPASGALSAGCDSCSGGEPARRTASRGYLNQPAPNAAPQEVAAAEGAAEAVGRGGSSGGSCQTCRAGSIPSRGGATGG